MGSLSTSQQLSPLKSGGCCLQALAQQQQLHRWCLTPRAFLARGRAYAISQSAHVGRRPRHARKHFRTRNQGAKPMFRLDIPPPVHGVAGYISANE